MSETDMNVLTDVYDRIYEFDALYEAYRCARKGKRYRDEVMRFTADLEGNLINLSNHLIWESYEVGPYHPFYVYEPKKRLVMSLQFPDRVVQWAIYNVLAPFYDKMFINDTFACREGKGSHAAADRLQYWMRKVDRKPETWYYLKLDISKYFYRVDHAVLERILARRIKDERLMGLLHKIINSEDQAFGLPAGYAPDEVCEDDWLYDTGMPIGNLTSQLFANIYLNELDQYCKHVLHIQYYIRYMDDIIILHPDKRRLASWRDYISDFLEDVLHLSLNRKTAMRKCNKGIDFVGYRIWATHRRLKRKTARRMIRRFKGMCRLLAGGQMSREKFNRVVASYRGVLEHCNSKGLRRKLNRIYLESLQKPEVLTMTFEEMAEKVARATKAQSRAIDSLYMELCKRAKAEELAAMPCMEDIKEAATLLKELGLL